MAPTLWRMRTSRSAASGSRWSSSSWVRMPASGVRSWCAASALLGLGGLFEAVEHLVELGHQRPDLDGGDHRVEGLQGAVFEVVEGAPDVFDREQRVAHAEPDGEPGGGGKEEQRQGERHGEVDFQLVALAGGFGGDEDEGLARNRAVDGDDAHPVAAEVGVEAAAVAVDFLLVEGLVGQAGVAGDEAFAGAEDQVVDVVHAVGAQHLFGGGRKDEARFAVDDLEVRNEGQAGVGQGLVEGFHGGLVHQVVGQR